jgi:hypothetical protein
MPTPRPVHVLRVDALSLALLGSACATSPGIHATATATALDPTASDADATRRWTTPTSRSCR